MPDAVLPYGKDLKNSGWSGSVTSRDRALTEDANGTTSSRQNETLAFVEFHGLHGATWKELAEWTGFHHGQASGVLSVLHKAGLICRLTDERRNRCAVYVSPNYVNGRDTSEQGRGLKCSSDYAIERVRELHFVTTCCNDRECATAICAHCGLMYPCPTINAVDGGK